MKAYVGKAFKKLGHWLLWLPTDIASVALRGLTLITTAIQERLFGKDWEV